MCTAGPPSKRQKADIGIDDFDDEELLALAQSQLPEPSGHKGAAAAAAEQSANFPKTGLCNSALPAHHSSTQEALDEEQEIAELVRLANSTVSQSDHAAAQHHSMDDLPESSKAAADRMQEAGTSWGPTAEPPSWSGANIAGDSMSITLGDGRRAFCRLHSKQDSFSSQRQHRQGTLLSVPISTLMQDVEQEAFAKALQESEVLQRSATDGLLTPHPIMAEHQLHQQTLWVDKYSPKSFFELLSDEQINRDVVKWVKSWDACVHRKQTTQSGPMAAQQHLGPEQKLLLLSGPPGNILANHLLATQAAC